MQNRQLGKHKVYIIWSWRQIESITYGIYYSRIRRDQEKSLRFLRFEILRLIMIHKANLVTTSNPLQTISQTMSELEKGWKDRWFSMLDNTWSKCSRDSSISRKFKEILFCWPVWTLEFPSPEQSNMEYAL